MRFLSIIGVFAILIAYVAAHPISTFAMRLVPANYTIGEVSTVTFQFLDELNNNAPVAFTNLMNYHGRFIHIQFASEDYELIWHVHPEDFYDVTSTGSGTYFWVQATFPRAGRYFVAASFLFQNGTSYREGASSETLSVNGGVPMNNATVFNYTAVEYFQSYPIDQSDRIIYPIDVNTNLASEYDGIKVVFQVIQEVSINNHTHTSMTMTTGGNTQPGLSTNPADNNMVVINTCAPFYLQIFLNESGSPAATNLIPYLKAPVHFSLVAPDGSLYHAHGSYLPDGTLFPDLAGMVASHSGVNMTEESMINDPMMNLTMNGMMMGIMPNGSVNCRTDAGKVMEYMPSMDHSLYYGPATFGPTLVGLFDWPGYGNWRLFAWIKLQMPNGEERLIVPHFSVQTILEAPTTSTGHHHHHDSSGSAPTTFSYLYLLVILISMGLFF